MTINKTASATIVLLLIFGSNQLHAALQVFASQSAVPTNLFSVNPATGAATVIGNTSFSPGLEFRGDGLLYGSSSSLKTINPSTGAATTVASLPDLMVSIAFNLNDELFAVNNTGDTLFKLNPATGSTLASMPITGTVHPSGTAFPGEINGIDFGPDGTLYGIGFALYSINPLTGNATRITPLGANVSGAGAGVLFDDLDFGSEGVLRGLTAENNSRLFTINPLTGLGSLVGSTGFALNGLASVPEPSAVALMGIGALGLLACLARRSRIRV